MNIYVDVLIFLLSCAGTTGIVNSMHYRVRGDSHGMWIMVAFGLCCFLDAALAPTSKPALTSCFAAILVTCAAYDTYYIHRR